MSSSATALFALTCTAVASVTVTYFGYPILERLLAKRFQTYIHWIVSTRDKMFHPVKPANVVLALTISMTLMTGTGYFFSRGYGLITLVFTLLFFYLGYSIPRWWVQVLWNRRLKKFDQQLVDGLTLLANSLRSGLNLPKAIEVLVQEMPNPLSQEFGLVVSQQKIGLTLDEALEKMLERIPSDDLGIAIHSILILRETGGDLSETFEVIAKTIRERRKVDGKINAMTQQGRTQGLLLFVMPFALLALLYTMMPEFILPLFRTQLGWMMILAMLFFQIIGGLWIKKIVTIDI